MTWEIWAGLIAGIGALIGVLTPIIKLSMAISKLTTTVEILNKSLGRIEQAVDKNSEEINEIKVQIAKLGGKSDE